MLSVNQFPQDDAFLCELSSSETSISDYEAFEEYILHPPIVESVTDTSVRVTIATRVDACVECVLSCPFPEGGPDASIDVECAHIAVHAFIPHVLCFEHLQAGKDYEFSIVNAVPVIMPSTIRTNANSVNVSTQIMHDTYKLPPVEASTPPALSPIHHEAGNDVPSENVVVDVLKDTVQHFTVIDHRRHQNHQNYKEKSVVLKDSSISEAHPLNLLQLKHRQETAETHVPSAAVSAAAVEEAIRYVNQNIHNSHSNVDDDDFGDDERNKDEEETFLRSLRDQSFELLDNVASLQSPVMHLRNDDLRTSNESPNGGSSKGVDVNSKSTDVNGRRSSSRIFKPTQQLNFHSNNHIRDNNNNLNRQTGDGESIFNDVDVEVEVAGELDATMMQTNAVLQRECSFVEDDDDLLVHNHNNPNNTKNTNDSEVKNIVTNPKVVTLDVDLRPSLVHYYDQHNNEASSISQLLTARTAHVSDTDDDSEVDHNTETSCSALRRLDADEFPLNVSSSSGSVASSRDMGMNNQSTTSNRNSSTLSFRRHSSASALEAVQFDTDGDEDVLQAEPVLRPVNQYPIFHAQQSQTLIHTQSNLKSALASVSPKPYSRKPASHCAVIPLLAPATHSALLMQHAAVSTTNPKPSCKPPPPKAVDFSRTFSSPAIVQGPFMSSTQQTDVVPQQRMSSSLRSRAGSSAAVHELANTHNPLLHVCSPIKTKSLIHDGDVAPTMAFDILEQTGSLPPSSSTATTTTTTTTVQNVFLRKHTAQFNIHSNVSLTEPSNNPHCSRKSLNSTFRK